MTLQTGTYPTTAAPKPDACPDCGAPKHRLYQVVGQVDSTMPGGPRTVDTQEAWGCRDCGYLTAWHLASVGVLVAVQHGPPTPPPKPAPPAAASREAIRQLLAAEDGRVDPYWLGWLVALLAVVAVVFAGGVAVGQLL